MFCESGPEQKEYTEKDDYGVFKTCPFLPSPRQYLQSRHANKQTFFSGLNGLVSQAWPVPSPCPAPNPVFREHICWPAEPAFPCGHGAVGESEPVLLLREEETDPLDGESCSRVSRDDVA